MKRRKSSGDESDENATKRIRTGSVDSGEPRGMSAESASLPASLSHIVGDYLPIDERYYAETAFASVQSLTLCLSQDVGSKLAPHWSIGFLPPNLSWESSDVKIDKEYPIKDFEGCLQLLETENSNCYRVAITVLVVKLNMTSDDLLSALNDLRKTIEELRHHWNNVKYVVFSMSDCISCSFTLKNVIDMETGKRQPVDPMRALFTIIDDLDRCWNDNHTLAVHYLFAFYFKSEAKPASDVYLENFVIPLNSDPNRKLFKNEASEMLSTKIMWICSLKSYDDTIHFDQVTTRLCHAFDFTMHGIVNYSKIQICDRVPKKLCFQDNPFVERINVNSGVTGRTVKLPRPSGLLTNAMPRSALRELTLVGDNNVVDLAELNNGYFPHLTQLYILDGKMKGHLDSKNVPRLKKLVIEVRTDTERTLARMTTVVTEHAQSLIDAGRPWQLVAFQDQLGWSFASYEAPLADCQDDDDDKEEEKVSPPYSPPVIKDLMLVLGCCKSPGDYHLHLNGDPPVKAATGDQSVPLLVWAPERVEKITAFSIGLVKSLLQFTEEIPERTRMLTSLECHNVILEVDGAVLPNLQSLEVHCSKMNMKGPFSQLQTLSLKGGEIGSAWRLDAPWLQTLRFSEVAFGSKLSLCPQQLPHLSSLWIEPLHIHPMNGPTLLMNEDNLGLSRVNYVVLGRGMTKSLYFNPCQVHNVSHLELTVDAFALPRGWFDAEWQCEILNLNIYAQNTLPGPKRGISLIMAPPLLLRVKKLAVTTHYCRVLLDWEMPELIDCKVGSQRSLGPNLWCPALKCIRFTDELSESDKEKCLNPDMYEAIGAQPSWVYFTFDNEARSMSWDVAPNETGISTFSGLLENDVDSVED